MNKIFKFVRLWALAAPGLDAATRPDTSFEWKLRAATMWYTGYKMGTADEKGGMELDKLQRGWEPYLWSILVTRGLGKLSGIIRSF